MALVLLSQKQIILPISIMIFITRERFVPRKKVCTDLFLMEHGMLHMKAKDRIIHLTQFNMIQEHLHIITSDQRLVILIIPNKQ